MTGPGEPVLSVDGLRASYRSRARSGQVLAGVSLTVQPGEALGLVGESGCGKSTLALALMRALPANGSIGEGRIIIAGTNVLGLTAQELRRWRGSTAAMVYQDPRGSLTPSLTVGEQVAEVFRYHEASSGRQAREAASGMLARVGLGRERDFLGRYPHQLSGGQRQRVVIAMALAARPRLLILDEPTTGLDTTVQAGILDLIESLRGEFIDALVFITHNLGLVARTCDRVSVLYAGRVVEDGPVHEVLARPAHPYTAALIACVPGATARADQVSLPAIPGSPPGLGDTLPGCTFAPRCPLVSAACLTGEPALTTYSFERNVRCVAPGQATAATPAVPARTAGPGGAGSEVLLELRGIGKRYRQAVACDGIDLTVRRGETLGLVGESGSGKTTLARIISGLAEPDTGEIRWRGAPLAAAIARRPRSAARALQLVPQHPDSSLNPRRRVRSILARAVKRLDGPQPVAELADAVRLEPRHLDSRAHELSGGQKQRAAIARAFAGRPDLVVCDEPVSSLDVSVQAVILNLLADLQRARGTSYVFISHDLAVVRYLAHTVAVIYRSQIVETGRAADVFSAPHHPYTALLLAAAPDAGDQHGGSGADGFLSSSPAADEPGCRFAARCPVRLGTVCETDPPPWQVLDRGHQIRCHLPPSALARPPASAGARPSA